MPNYQNGKIYRIVCNKTGLQYIGSTTISLASRLSQHRNIFNNKSCTHKSCTSRNVLANNDYSIILIQDCPCDRKEQLLQCERHYIETLECVNKQIPLRSRHDWYEDNKETYIERQKIWNNNNKEKLKVYHQTFKNKNKGVFVDLTNIDVDDEHIKLSIEDIYDSNELVSEEEIYNYIENKINNKPNLE
jgi:hypothetical protein